MVLIQLTEIISYVVLIIINKTMWYILPSIIILLFYYILICYIINIILIITQKRSTWPSDVMERPGKTPAQVSAEFESEVVTTLEI